MKNRVFICCILGFIILSAMGFIWVDEKGNIEDSDYIMEIEVRKDGYVLSFVELSAYEKQISKKEYERKVYVYEKDFKKALKMYKGKYKREADVSRVESIIYKDVAKERIEKFVDDVGTLYRFPPKIYYEMFEKIK